MKILNRLLSIQALLIILFLAGSCDQVQMPYLEGENNILPNDSEDVRKVLIEDYTGFKCGNCPKAHEAGRKIKDQYGENVIILAVHAGRFYADPDPLHPYDFRTSAGNSWDKFFGMSALGLPKGMINRMDYPIDYIKTHDTWQNHIDEILSEKPIVSIILSSDYDASTRKIDISVEYEYNLKLDNYHNLNVCIVEDSIVQFQKDYFSDPGDIYDYVHDHVLRLALNGEWGEELTEQVDTKNFTYTIPFDSDWRPEKLKILAFISDVGNTYEIYQAEQISLITKK